MMKALLFAALLSYSLTTASFADPACDMNYEIDASLPGAKEVSAATSCAEAVGIAKNYQKSTVPTIRAAMMAVEICSWDFIDDAVLVSQFCKEAKKCNDKYTGRPGSIHGILNARCMADAALEVSNQVTQ